MAVWKALQVLGSLLAILTLSQGVISPVEANPEPTIIGGTQPDKRPAAAPAITEFDKSDAWYDQALRGVEQPYPYSLRFLEDQGGWFTPFNRPGMPGRYDIRGLHRQ